MDVAAALRRLEAEDPGLARDAEVAFDSLTAGGDIEEVGQLDLQGFLWYVLPEKFLADATDQWGVAVALRRLLELLDRPRYADICASERTRAVLAAYDEGEAAGRAAMRAAMAASGVEPVDVPELAWGAVMGGVEAGAYAAVAAGLERAIEAGELVPGGRAWRRRQRTLVRQLLLRSRADFDGESLLDRVLEERVESWVTAFRGRREELLRPLQATLTGPATLPEDVGHHVAAVRWLLQRAAGGLALTQTHRLRPADVRALAAEHGWDIGARLRHLEEDLAEVAAARRLAEAVGGLRRRGARLVLTGAGAGLLADPAALWRRLCGALVGPTVFETAVGELALVLLHRNRVSGRDELVEEVAAVIAGEPWRSPDGRRPDARDVGWALVDLRWRLASLRLLDSDPSRPSRELPWRLNPAGRVAAVEALRTRATRPRRSPIDR